jgi:hypothetical protein
MNTIRIGDDWNFFDYFQRIMSGYGIRHSRISIDINDERDALDIVCGVDPNRILKILPDFKFTYKNCGLSFNDGFSTSSSTKELSDTFLGNIKDNLKKDFIKYRGNIYAIGWDDNFYISHHEESCFIKFRGVVECLESKGVMDYTININTHVDESDVKIRLSEKKLLKALKYINFKN